MDSSAEFLGEPRLRPLWSAVHRRLEETGGNVAGVAVHLRDLGDDERAAVDRLLGVRSRGKTQRVELTRLDALLLSLIHISRRRAIMSMFDTCTAVSPSTSICSETLVWNT